MSPISRPIALGDIPPLGRSVRIVADAGEAAALAARNGLEAVRSFEAELTVTPWRRSGLTVEGAFKAVVVQICGVSLEPFEQPMEERFTLRFLPAEDLSAEAQRTAFSLEDEDPPDVLEGDSIDLGAIAEEQFALAIDPYPRAPGAELPAAEGESLAESADSPFAALAALKRADGERP